MRWTGEPQYTASQKARSFKLRNMDRDLVYNPARAAQHVDCEGFQHVDCEGFQLVNALQKRGMSLHRMLYTREGYKAPAPHGRKEPELGTTHTPPSEAGDLAVL